MTHSPVDVLRSGQPAEKSPSDGEALAEGEGRGSEAQALYPPPPPEMELAQPISPLFYLRKSGDSSSLDHSSHQEEEKHLIEPSAVMFALSAGNPRAAPGAIHCSGPDGQLSFRKSSLATFSHIVSL